MSPVHHGDDGVEGQTEATSPRWPVRVMWAATGVFVVVFSALVLYKHAHLGTRAFDLGIFDQGLWLLSEGETPFVTMRGLHIFGDHTSFLLFPLVPLYWIWADVRVLMILTVLAMAAGAPLVYAAARTLRIDPRRAAALGVAFLLLPAVQWQVWDVFHPEALAVPLLLAAYLLALRARPGWAFAALTLVLLAKEDAALVVVPLALYLGFKMRARWLAIGGAALGIVALVVNFAVLLPHWSPTGRLVYTGRYSEFGESMPEIAWGVATSPGAVLGELFAGDSLLLLAGIVLPFVVALAAPRVLLIGLPTLLANVLSIHFYQAQLQYHYTAYLIAVVAIAGVAGAQRLTDRHKTPLRRPTVFIAVVLVAGVAGSLFGGPWGVGRQNPWVGYAGRTDLVTEALAVIPADASVAADSRLAAHLAHREKIYVFPNPHLSRNWSAGGVDPAPPDDFEWLAMRSDLVGMDEELLEALDEVLADGAFTEVVANAEVTVWTRASPAAKTQQEPPPNGQEGSSRSADQRD